MEGYNHGLVAEAHMDVLADGQASSGASALSTTDFSALNLYGWHWQPESTVDENYMDLAYLVARNSSCKDGHMGCVIVRDIAAGVLPHRQSEVYWYASP